MTNKLISDATLLSPIATDLIPVARLGDTTAYNATISDLVSVFSSLYDVLIYKDGSDTVAIASDGSEVSRDIDTVTVIKASLSSLSSGGLLLFKYDNYTLTGITSADNNTPIFSINSNTIVDGGGSTFTITSLPTDSAYNFLFWTPATSQSDIVIRNMTMDGNKANNVGPEKEYLIIGEDSTPSNITIENVKCINSTRNGIVPRGVNWKVLNVITEDNDIAGVELENCTGLIIDGHISSGDVYALYDEGTNARLALSNFFYSNNTQGMRLGVASTSLDDLVILNGVIDQYTSRGILAGANVSRFSMSNVVFHGTGGVDLAIQTTNGVDISDCQIDGYAALQGEFLSISNGSVDCTYVTLTADNCVIQGVTINMTWRTSHDSENVLYNSCIYTGGFNDSSSINIKHINCMGDTISENSGTGSIVSGLTSDIITHGLSATPSAQNIQITLTENPDNTPGAIWVDTITSTQFTVNCENDPGASNLDFGWRASVY